MDIETKRMEDDGKPLKRKIKEDELPDLIDHDATEEEE